MNFKYPGATNYAVQGVSTEFKVGKYIAVVGPSGAGKSTFVDLLLGLHHSTSGTVQISGLDAIDAIERWPGAIGYVPQEIQLVSGSIVENILLGFIWFLIEICNHPKNSTSMYLDHLDAMLLMHSLLPWLFRL